MKAVIIVLTVIILCIGKFSYAQAIVFNRLYDYNNFNDGASSIIETNDSNFLFVGASFLGSDNRNLIVKLTTQGDTLWSKRYTLSIGGDNANSVIELTNGNFLLCGTLHDTTTVTAKGYLMLVNAQGDSLWMQQYGSGINSDWAMNLAQTPDGGFVVSGWTWLAPGFSTSNAWLFKTDSLGNLLWQKQFDGYGFGTFFNKVIIPPDSNIVCAGVTATNTVTGLDYVVKLNQQGDTIWTKQFGGAGGGGIFDINPTQDGGFIGCGAKEGVSGSQRASVYKLDSLGNVLWYNTYARGSGPSEYYSFAAIHELPNGNFMAAGSDFDYTQPVPASSTRIRMMEFNANGDSIWSKQYPHSTGGDEDYMFDMKLTSDGGFIICGYVIHTSPTKNDALVIKIDSNRCDNVTCQLTIGVEEEKKFGVDFLIYPNPTTGIIHIENEEKTISDLTVTIYNLLGEKVYNGWITQNAININHLDNGLYFIQLTNKNNKQLATQKLLLQK
jgi:hypothetical protein